MADEILGMETGDLSEWGTVSGATYESTTIRTGSGAVAITGSNYVEQDAGATNDQTVAFYFRTTTLPASAADIVVMRNGGVDRVSVQLNTDGTLSIGTGGSGTSSTALSTGTWYLIELQADESLQDIKVRINEGEEISDTSASIAQQPRHVRFLHAGASGTSYIDDVVVNNSLTYPGAGQIEAIRPDGEGTNTDWVVTSGGSGNIVTDVKDGSNTTGAEETDAGGGTHDFTLETISSIGTINGIKSCWIASRGSGSGTTHSVGALDDDGTPTNVASIVLTTSDAYDDRIESTYTPSTQAELDRLEFQVVKSSGGRDMYVREIWVMVWHTPSGGEPSTAIKDVIGYGVVPFAR